MALQDWRTFWCICMEFIKKSKYCVSQQKIVCCMVAQFECIVNMVESNENFLKLMNSSLQLSPLTRQQSYSSQLGLMLSCEFPLILLGCWSKFLAINIQDLLIKEDQWRCVEFTHFYANNVKEFNYKFYLRSPRYSIHKMLFSLNIHLFS